MKKIVPKKTLLYTLPVLIIGTYDENAVPNIMAVSWGGICNSEPPCIAISVRKGRHTYGNLMKNHAFTVNIPPESMVNEADYCGVFSGRNENKFEKLGLTAVHAGVVNAPIVDQFPMAVCCKVINSIELGTHVQFIGEVIEVLAEESVLSGNGLPSIELIRPFIYDSATMSYYSIGNKLTGAYRNVK